RTSAGTLTFQVEQSGEMREVARPAFSLLARAARSASACFTPIACRLPRAGERSHGRRCCFSSKQHSGGHHGERENLAGSVSRYAEGHLLRRKENSHSAAEDGQGQRIPMSCAPPSRNTRARPKVTSNGSRRFSRPST